MVFFSKALDSTYSKYWSRCIGKNKDPINRYCYPYLTHSVSLRGTRLAGERGGVRAGVPHMGRAGPRRAGSGRRARRSHRARRAASGRRLY